MDAVGAHAKLGRDQEDGRMANIHTHPELDIRSRTYPVGTPVEVRSRFDHRWTHGFSVADAGQDEYLIRRLSDGSVLPAWFPAGMIRRDPAD